jgi:tRNA nucleotidyltransferase/poly(A) polymerase
MPLSQQPPVLPAFLARLEPLVGEASFPVYLVGGAVRDALRGVSSHDLDFAVPHGAIKLAFTVANALGVPAFVLDRERDTGRVVLDKDGIMLDFARFRGNDLEADLRGRDFTVNAMAWRIGGPPDQNVTDPTGGVSDLAQGILRQTRDGAIAEDPVRALRAVRLRHSLGFSLEPTTAKAAAAAAASLGRISAERVRDELLRIMNLHAVAAALEELMALGLLPAVLPEIAALGPLQQSPPHRDRVLAHTQSVLRWLTALTRHLLGQDAQPGSGRQATLPSEAVTLLASFRHGLQEHLERPVAGLLTGLDLLVWSGLFHDAGKAAAQTEDASGRIRFLGHEQAGATLVASRLRALRFSNEAIRHVEAVVAGHMRPLLLAQQSSVSRRAVFRYFRALDGAGIDVVLLSLADHLATYEGATDPAPGDAAWEALIAVCRQLLAHYYEAYETTVRPTPLVDGHALMEALGIAAGPELGRLLRLIEEAQAAGEVATRTEALALASRERR